MIVLQGLGILAAAAVVVSALYALESFSMRRFNHRFFTGLAFWLVAISGAGLVFGHEWWKEAAAAQGDQLNGILLMATGAVIILGCLVQNIRRTNVLLGTTGTAVQVGIFGTMATVGLVLLIIGFMLTVLLYSGARPVYVVNR